MEVRQAMLVQIAQLEALRLNVVAEITVNLNRITFLKDRLFHEAAPQNYLVSPLIRARAARVGV